MARPNCSLSGLISGEGPQRREEVTSTVIRSDESKASAKAKKVQKATFILEKLLHKPSGHGYIAAADVLQLPLTDIQFPSLLALRRPVHTDQPDGWQAQQCTQHQSAWFHQISGHTTLQA